MANEPATTNEAHSRLIRDQFTRQAVPFSTASPIADPGALRAIVAAAAPGPDDTLLDVACGGGIVVCAFAPHVRDATGIDMTPAMLDRARALAAEKGVGNVAWREGPDRYAKAKEAGRLNEIPTNHNPRFAPVIHPTLQTGVEALIVAARAWLAP